MRKRNGSGRTRIPKDDNAPRILRSRSDYRSRNSCAGPLMTGAGNLIDLTGDHSEAPLRVAMVTRFPPSCSGAAQPASDLAETLVRCFGIDVEVIRFVPLRRARNRIDRKFQLGAKRSRSLDSNPDLHPQPRLEGLSRGSTACVGRRPVSHRGKNHRDGAHGASRGRQGRKLSHGSLLLANRRFR